MTGSINKSYFTQNTTPPTDINPIVATDNSVQINRTADVI